MSYIYTYYLSFYRLKVKKHSKGIGEVITLILLDKINSDLLIDSSSYILRAISVNLELPTGPSPNDYPVTSQ
jgi:hypothetical protein